MQDLGKRGRTADGQAAHLLLVKDIQRRLQKLESENKTTFVKRLTASASAVALMLGLILTLHAIYDAFWIKREADRIAAVTQFNQAVSSAAKTRQELEQLAVTDPVQKGTIVGWAMPRIMGDVATAREILPTLRRDDVGIPQLIILITEALNINDLESAKQFVAQAVAKEKETDYLKSEARRYQGRYFFTVKNVAAGRKAFNASYDLAHDNPIARAYILTDISIGELYTGNCNEATSAFDRAMGEIDASGAYPELRNQYLAYAANFLRTWPTAACPLPKSAKT
jgi:hypothetical protein